MGNNFGSTAPKIEEEEDIWWTNGNRNVSARSTSVEETTLQNNSLIKKKDISTIFKKEDNLRSEPKEEEGDIWWTNGNRKIGETQRSVEDKFSQTESDSSVEKVRDISLNQLSDRNREKLNEFKFEMERKHEKRRDILASKKKEFDDLREEARKLKEENEKLKNSQEMKYQEYYTKEIEKLQAENDHLRLSLSTNQPSSVHIEELDKILRENTNLKGELKDKIEQLSQAATLLDKNRELKISIAEMQSELQNLNSVVVDFEKEREEYKAHVVALKDVISVSKKMLLIRESQLKELREKVESIEESLSGKELNILSQDLRLEYERQLQSIRNLRELYEERQRSDYKEKEELRNVIEEYKKELESQQNKNKEAEARISELEEDNSQKYDQIKSLESNLGLSKAEARQYQAELTVINQLFSEILLGFNSSQEIDLDKLTKHLEDHHELLQNIVINEMSPETSFALPKVLLDLVTQVNIEKENKLAKETVEYGRLETILEESESQTSTEQTQTINSVEEIVELLPKVWRVLIELLSHQKAPNNILSTEDSSDEDPCYKTVQTPKGPSLVLSVSQTFIRLKNLILEKKSLEKETGHLKQLNTHLENRLQDQEKRLGMVTSELNKTWHVVGKLQKQHQLLHTQEKILRYELAQKRKLLNSLKEELEYSREKWQEAREKNSKTETQWRQLRIEFASRRNTIVSDECSTSGYSDERATSSSDDEPGYESDESESAQKQGEEQEEQEENETVATDNSCDRIAQLQEPTYRDDEESLTPLPQSTDESLSIENTIEDRVTLVENSIELGHITLESKHQAHSSLSSEEPTCSKVQAKSSCLVSSVIDEAIAAILQNSSPVITEEVPVSDVASNMKLSEAKTETECICPENALPVLRDPEPSSSSSTRNPKIKTLEELLTAKEERLKRLEGQCEQLVQKVTNTTQKSVMISNKLDDLHEVYGESSQVRAASNVAENLEDTRTTCENNDNQE